MKPLIIGLDVDEVCLDLFGPWLAAYNFAFNDTLLPEDIRDWDVAKFVVPECGAKIFGFVNSDLYKRVYPLPRAKAAIDVLRSLGHRVVFVTSCINGTEEAKRDCLIKWGMLPPNRRREDFVSCSDKSLAAVDVLFDDRLETIEAFPRHGVLIDAPHNSHRYTPKPRLSSLACAPAYLALNFP